MSLQDLLQRWVKQTETDEGKEQMVEAWIKQFDKFQVRDLEDLQVKSFLGSSRWDRFFNKLVDADDEIFIPGWDYCLKGLQRWHCGHKSTLGSKSSENSEEEEGLESESEEPQQQIFAPFHGDAQLILNGSHIQIDDDKWTNLFSQTKEEKEKIQVMNFRGSHIKQLSLLEKNVSEYPELAYIDLSVGSIDLLKEFETLKSIAKTLTKRKGALVVYGNCFGDHFFVKHKLSEWARQDQESFLRLIWIPSCLLRQRDSWTGFFHEYKKNNLVNGTSFLNVIEAYHSTYYSAIDKLLRPYT